MEKELAPAGANIDLETLQIGGRPSLWIFVDEWGLNEKGFKDGEIFTVKSVDVHYGEDKTKGFPYLNLSKFLEKENISEDYKLSVYALRSDKKLDVKSIIGKNISLSKYGSRLKFEVLN